MERMEAERTRTTELLGLPTGVRGLDLMMRAIRMENSTSSEQSLGREDQLLAQGAIANAQKERPRLCSPLR